MRVLHLHAPLQQLKHQINFIRMHKRKRRMILNLHELIPNKSRDSKHRKVPLHPPLQIRQIIIYLLRLLNRPHSNLQLLHDILVDILNQVIHMRHKRNNHIQIRIRLIPHTIQHIAPKILHGKPQLQHNQQAKPTIVLRPSLRIHNILLQLR